MKPSRLQIALKSSGRTSKYIKMLRPAVKIFRPGDKILKEAPAGPAESAGVQRGPARSRRDLRGNCAGPKNPFFSSKKSVVFFGWDGQIHSHLADRKKRNDSGDKFPRPVGVFESCWVAAQGGGAPGA